MVYYQVFRCCQQHPLSANPEDAPPPSAGARVAPVAAANSETDKRTMYLAGAPIDGCVVRLRRSRATAFHEGGHAAVHLALGNRIIRATIDGQAHVGGGGRLLYPGNVIVALAGDAAEAWLRSELARAPDDELPAWVGGIRNLCGGSCDRCRAIRQCVVGTRHAPDADVIATFRRLENCAGMIVRSPEVWAAITELAGALMARGTLGSRAINTICARYFQPGAFAHLFNQKDHQRA
jgi:hypothetical protein